MISNLAVTTVIKHALIPVIPSLAQFSASVATKCVTYGASSALTFVHLRGGDAPALDLDRVDLRLGSLEQYCVIASIILGATIGKDAFPINVG